MPRIVRLRKDPIVDAVCEARFAKVETPLSIVLPGIIASEFKSEIASIRQTPAASVPEPIAQVDSSWAYAHKHILVSKEGWTINVADRAVSVGYTGAYPGWKVFSPLIERVLSAVFESGMVQEAERFSTKYVNFFEGAVPDISEKLKVKISLGGSSLDSKPVMLRTESKLDSVVSVIQIIHPAQIQQQGKEVRHGLVLDIDTVRSGPFQGVEKDFMKYVQEARNQERREFFSLLTDATLKDCEPDYE